MFQVVPANAPVNCIDAGGSVSRSGPVVGACCVGASVSVIGDGSVDVCVCCVGASECHRGHIGELSVVMKGGGGVKGGGQVGVYMEDDEDECGLELLLKRATLQQELRILSEAVLSAGGPPRA